MRFADFAVDLAAVIKASRSVASHHAALRARQLDALSRTSGIGIASVRRQGPGAHHEQTRAQNTTSDTVPAEDDAEELTSTDEPVEGRSKEQRPVVHTSHGQTLNSPRHADGATISPMGSGSVLSQLQHKTGAKFPVSTGTEVHSPFNPAASTPRVQEPLSRENFQEVKVGGEHKDVPPDVDINVFRTNQGSKILGSLGKGGAQKAPRPRPAVQYPAPWSGLPSSAPLNRVAGEKDELKGASAVESKPAAEPAKAQSTKFPPTPPQPSGTIDQIPLPNPIQGRTYVLKESKVPATRLSRVWNYSGLAAGMLGGALTEGLTRVVGGGGTGSVMLSESNMERLVAKLSRMRGAALKMGQMLSFQDAKMLPGPIHEVLQRVQDRADYMPSYQRDKVLVSNLGENWRDLFEEFEETPIAAASIGQVHKATLKSTGKAVAVKIQFPGVADSINSDLDNLGILLTATKLLPKGLYLDKTINNARTELGWECDYEREAKCLKRFRELMAGETDVFVVPDVHLEASGKQVITMDFMQGSAVTRIPTFTQAQKDWIGTQILRLCLREITEFHFMQTDPNWTNFLYNSENSKLELLDFGASREYPKDFVDHYVRLLAAASRSDRPKVKQLSEDLGYLTGLESKAMLDAHIGSVLTLAEPFLESAPEVYDFQDQTITERVKGFIPVMLKERLAPPPEETYSLHRKLSGAFLLCARLGSKVRCRDLFQEALKRGGYLDEVTA
ncbi:hypothetical protein jhhlp_008744 [Lomentospora prolificans]|uniref:ABC1 atypical kinase-like domain-containing protein n=1 Tax=Lomentospora prolificans TaxID=41688 RepID=A0A2N3MYX0_9PEZI|nr:hypothetical protein jhhlp_008744 [Lomentospora prolificans]